ncbi:MAG: sigma-70 family RNA polymerase sigma factor [Candidatus Methylacidiphilales bacterium]|nr:sigma-70 family RNA polymerase sigma factor [Candidatus Methylacidiphilales bacterium]
MGEDARRPGEPDLTDEQLVDQVLSGSVSSYDWLVLRYKERLYGVLYNMTSNHEDTNDLLMETFDKAFRSLSTYQKNASFYTWIYRIGVNRALNHLNKRKKTRNTFSLNDIEMDDQLEKQFADVKVVGGDRSAELSELQKKLNESLQRLSDEHRAVVVLFDIDGQSHADIAKIMGCSEGTVRSRLHYAHQKLQKMLESYLR